MGEVYRARDPRLGRDVAVKVLPAGATSADQAVRLEREARATGALNHPNILVVFDVGLDDGRPFVVSELLEGETLRHRLRGGPLPVRKALEYGALIAEGLAAAHDRGIFHRDLKPENVFVTLDGRVKILDFGLAKILSPPGGAGPVAADASTQSGIVLGTTAYMSPEQAGGEATDHRTDVFSFGAVLYEMVSGRRAFRGANAVETLNAVLKEDPPELQLDSGLGVGVAHLIRRCLEKRVEDRFQSARDLAFQLRELLGVWATTRPHRSGRLRGLRAWTRPAAALVLGAALGAAAVWSWRAVPAPLFRQITFHRGAISNARFGPDGRSVVYSAAWEGQPPEVRLGLLEGPESRSLGLSGARLLSVSPKGEVALLLRQRHAGAERMPGTLARVPVAGGAPRELADGVEDAAWGPGEELAVVRSKGVGGLSVLEFPAGRELYRTSGAVRHVRVSPDGGQVAFFDDPAGFGFGGAVAVVDRSGGRRSLTRRWPNARGLAWAPDGDEVWFTAGDEGDPRALWAVALSGRERLVARTPTSLTLHDLGPDGRALVSVDAERRGVIGRGPGEPAEKELSWFDRAGLADLSADGRLILFGDRLGVYVRDTLGSPAARLGDGFANSLSADGRWALATSRAGDRILLLPTRAGQPREVTSPGIATYESAWLMSDGETLVFNGHEEGRPMRAYRVPLAGGPRRAITPEGTWGAGLAAEPGLLVATGAESLSVYPVDGGEGRPIPGTGPGDRPAGWSADGRSLWVFRRGELPVPVEQVDVATGARTPWKALSPGDPAGIVFVTLVRVTPDGAAYAYSYRRILSDLFVVAGLR